MELTLRPPCDAYNFSVGLRFLENFVHPAYRIFRVSYLSLNRSFTNPNPKQLGKEMYFFHFFNKN
jgi:hypothetical protein